MPATGVDRASATPRAFALIRWRCRPSLAKHPFHTATDQRRHIGDDKQRAYASASRKITGFPYGIEFVFELAEPLEIVEALATVVDQVTEAVPQRRKRMTFKA